MTATRRETTLQRTPIAISVFSQTQLDRQQVVNIVDIQRFVPSLQFNQQAAQGAVLLTLRGIGNDSAFTEIADPEVAIYVDGIYSPRAQGGTSLVYDLERIEVLRGPQGTLFGRNATAGALSLVTAKPKTDQLSAYVEAIGGSYSRFGSRGAFNLPLSDTLAVRFAFATEQHDGYASYQQPPILPGVDPTRFVTSGKRYYAQDEKSGRLSLSWSPGTKFHWNANIESFLDKGAPAAPLMQTPRTGERIFSLLADTPPDNDRYALGIRSTMSYDFSDYLEATYITGYNKVGGTSLSDADFGVPPILNADGTFNAYASEQDKTVLSRSQFFSNEVQLKSRGRHRIEWIVGGFYSTEKNAIRYDIDDRDGYRGGPASYAVSFIQPGRRVHSYAGFGQATWNVDDRLRLTGGLRYTVDRKVNAGGAQVDCGNTTTCPAVGIEGQYPHADAAELAALLGPDFALTPNASSATFRKLTYLGRVDFDLSQNILLYGSVSTGFKSGIIDDVGRVTGPETLTSYELGAKTRLFDRRLTLNFAGYYYSFDGYQVGQIEVVRDPVTNQIKSSSIRTLNAKGATAYGLEAEANGAITDQDHIQVAVAVQKTKLKSLLTLDQRFDSDPTDLDAQRQLKGNELPHAPRFSATLTYEHDFLLANGGKITPRGTVHYETSSFLSIFNGDRTNRVVDGQVGGYGSAFDKQKAYTRSDIAMRYTTPSGKYVIEGFVENVENGNIRTSSDVYPVSVTSGSFVSLLQPPRTYGARVRASF